MLGFAGCWGGQDRCAIREFDYGSSLIELVRIKSSCLSEPSTFSGSRELLWLMGEELVRGESLSARYGLIIVMTKGKSVTDMVLD